MLHGRHDTEPKEQNLYPLEHGFIARTDADTKQTATRAFYRSIALEKATQESGSHRLRRAKDKSRHLAIRRATVQPQILDELDYLRADHLHLQERLLAIAGRLALKYMEAAGRKDALPCLLELFGEVAVCICELYHL